MTTQRYQKIVIFGVPGSGKSTFANHIARRMGLRVHHLDRWFFTENWHERDRDEFLQIQQSFLDTDQWIIDGNALGSLELRYARADLVLYFAFPKYLCLWRILKRRFTRQRFIQDRAQGCKEIISFKLLKYLWKYNQRAEPLIKEVQKKHPQTTFYRITNTKDLKAVRRMLLAQRQS